MEKYDHKAIEEAARQKWAGLDLYSAVLMDDTRDPYYLLVEFPYPSGDLHIGHWYAFAVTDIYARLLRARGKNVLFPIGFDAFGLPAENAAIKNNVNPREWTYKNIERMKAQLATMGNSFDWSKEVTTCDPSYYQWTQWIFTKFFEHGLAERRLAAVKWCPKDQTVLANEQVIDGACERCGTPVEEKHLTQWFLKITDYAERLLKGLDNLPWREEIKEAQRAWIGKSEGAKIKFNVRTSDVPGTSDVHPIEVFTTRPDTIYGATFLVLAPEHQFIEGRLTSLTNAEEVKKYIEATSKKTERERSENREKTGVKLEGITAINPTNQEEIPVFVADFVLGSYGTGALMAVPAHDGRDYEFAQRFGLPVRQVIMPEFIDPVHTPEPGAKEAYRKMVAVILLNDKNEIAVLDWHGVEWGDHKPVTLLLGGIDEGESEIEAALREVREETGFIDVEYVSTLPFIARSRYYAAHKKENRVGDYTGVVLRLKSNAQNTLDPKESARHTHRFVPPEMAQSTTIGDSPRFVGWFRNMAPYLNEGVLINSGTFNERNSKEAKWDIVTAMGGERATQYRLRDWLVSRQRYWGCPIPIVYDPGGKPCSIPAEHLPWLLPTDVDFTPSGEAPLASSKELKERVTNLFGEGWAPEYDTLDTFVDSSWYFFRYLNPQDSHDFSDSALMKKWLPVNRYSGGSEHTTMHLFYARFFTKALYDLSLVSVEEPFAERFNRGLIMGPDGQKMSKSKGNVVNPDELVQKYGADAVRLYLAFIGPYNESGSYSWQLEGVSSMRKFLERVVRLVETSGRTTSRQDQDVVRPDMQQAVTRTSHKIANDADRFKFNTSVAALMTLMNELEKAAAVPNAVLADLVVMLSLFAPHLAEHLWERLGQEGSVHASAWPASGEIVAETAEVVVQVNGRRRGSVTLALDTSELEASATAAALPTVVTALGGKEPARIVYVPGKIINLVI